ncbi:MAG: hypothetical protein EZS28_012421 [Streblomastix strix]|uniref:RRM domain-containing protein n=1 Tax=Streblomastix strix TaxID=222440 RepID=A0A5J4WBW9_9EUKA|nr:MAG: hypothetical protein EZS28_012421 [Streblomastix strix]
MSQERAPSQNSWSEGSPTPLDQAIQPVQNPSEPTETDQSGPKRVKLFFSAIDYNMSAKDLEELIKPYAENIVVDMKHGFAFVEVDGDGENVIRNLDMNRQEQGGRSIHVQIAQENFRRKKKQEMLAQITDRMKDTLFIVGFDSQTIDRIEFVGMFEKFGTIKKHQFPRNFCFIQYEKDEDAEKAQVAMNGTTYKERKIVVEFSTTDAFNRDQPHPHTFLRDSERGRGRSFVRGSGRGGFENNFSRAPQPHYGVDPSMIDPEIRDRYMKEYGSDRSERDGYRGVHPRSHSHDRTHGYGYERDHEHERDHDRNGGYSQRYSSSFSSSSRQFPPYGPSFLPFDGPYSRMDNDLNILFSKRLPSIQSPLQHHEITREEYDRLYEFHYNQMMQMQYSKYGPSSDPSISHGADRVRPPYNANRGFDFARRGGGNWEGRGRSGGSWEQGGSKNWNDDEKWRENNNTNTNNSNWEKRDDRGKEREHDHSLRRSPHQSRDKAISTTITDRKDNKDKEVKVDNRINKADDNWSRDPKRASDLQTRPKGSEKDGEHAFQGREGDSKTRKDGPSSSSYQQQSQSSRIKPNTINKKSDDRRGRSWSHNSSNSRSGSASRSMKKGSKWVRGRSGSESSSSDEDRSQSVSINGHDHEHDGKPSSRRGVQLKQGKPFGGRDGIRSGEGSMKKGRRVRDSSHSSSRSESRSSVQSGRRRSKSMKKDKNGSKKKEKK